jgi:hypothetical protein
MRSFVAYRVKDLSRNEEPCLTAIQMRADSFSAFLPMMSYALGIASSNYVPVG